MIIMENQEVHFYKVGELEISDPYKLDNGVSRDLVWEMKDLENVRSVLSIPAREKVKDKSYKVRERVRKFLDKYGNVEQEPYDDGYWDLKIKED